MRAKLGAFQNHHSIDVLDNEMLFVQEFSGVLEKQQAVRALPLGIAVRKVRADVAEPRSPQQRIAKRVCHHVAVRMPHWALLVRHFNSPDDQLAPFGQAMQVIANAAAVAHAFFCSAWR